MFNFELNQLVESRVSDECGEVKGRAEYSTHENSYFVHYKAADGRAVSAWFDESDLKSVKAQMGSDGKKYL
ncbi:hypothetical protein SAMN05216516_1272 [Izhakiella capsodis]|uniref:Uncharacterized protein n=1 Tax=Izhakiella capsodis TaxID=1367852 RepID=A0A1I5BXA5_9GAMM|nr:hypothetical protein [Izhakiella capsodis]SFN79222.1 hypothetical protein SAMN05216516_1272 [Izhakiella capsodis]